jgi:hypothetical protein
VEVQKQTHMKSGCTKVGLELCKVNVMELLDCLELQHNVLTNDEVNASSAYKLPFKADVYRHLGLERYAAM